MDLEKMWDNEKNGYTMFEYKPELTDVCYFIINDASIKILVSDVIKRNFSETFEFSCVLCGKHVSLPGSKLLKRGNIVCEDCKVTAKHIQMYGWLSKTVPDIETYWDYSKNKVDPKNVVANPAYNESYYIVCPLCNKPYKKSKASILKTGCYCSSCKQSVANKYEESLEYCYPNTARQYSRAKNIIPANKIRKSSSLLCNFICDNGHNYTTNLERVVASEKSGWSGCPVCHGKVVETGKTDIKTLYPRVVELWDYDKNIKTPDKVSKGTNTRYWFKCPIGHSFTASMSHMIRSKDTRYRGCPICAGKSIKQGINDLLSADPSYVSKHWCYELNTTLPEKVHRGSSSKRYWFTCNNGHIFKALPNDFLMKKGTKTIGCPFCARQPVPDDYYLSEEDSFNNLLEKIDSWWGENSFLPEDFFTHSTKIANFVCDKGHPFQRDGYSVKTRGLYCPVCNGSKIIPGINDAITKSRMVKKYWDYERNKEDPKTIVPNSGKRCWFRCSLCEKPFIQEMYLVSTGACLCSECAKVYSSSKAEVELSSTIEDFGIEIIPGYRLGTTKKTVDIYIPSKNIAIEYNGLYYHSEAVGRGRNYHKDKLELCKGLGIDLIVVWEDDYALKKDLVIRMLKSKLGVSDELRINARDCCVTSVEDNEAKMFLQENHLQGAVNAAKFIGLRDSSKNLVAVLAYSNARDGCTIRRYATSCIVRGGFSKLLYELQRRGAKVVYTFSDNAISNGNLYKSCGFAAKEIVPPDYSYLRDGVREHKFNYRIKRFKKDLSLLYKEGMNEQELAALNNLHKVWDYGKIKWVKYLNNV